MSRQRWALAAILAFAAAARLLTAARSPLIVDEYAWLEIADRVSLSPLHLPLHGDQHPPMGAWLAAAGRALLGPNLLGYRLPAVVLGVSLVGLTFLLARRAFGPGAGLAAAALVATNEYLIGASHVATEKGYLAFAVLAAWRFERALETRGARAFVSVGLALGLAALTKQTAWLWAPPLAWSLIAAHGRASLRTRGPWLALASALLVALPDVAWNLAHPQGTDGSSRGVLWQLARLGPGLDLGPLALFLRPLQGFVEPVVSEYPSMTLLPGALLLGGAGASLWCLRSAAARRLQMLGFGPFLFFLLLGAGRGPAEFWWADLAVVPFACLTAGVLARLPRSALLASCAVLLGLPGTVRVIVADVNCHPPLLVAPPQGALARCLEDQRVLVQRFPERDHEALVRLGRWRLPAAAFYDAVRTRDLSPPADRDHGPGAASAGTSR